MKRRENPIFSNILTIFKKPLASDRRDRPYQFFHTARQMFHCLWTHLSCICFHSGTISSSAWFRNTSQLTCLAELQFLSKIDTLAQDPQSDKRQILRAARLGVFPEFGCLLVTWGRTWLLTSHGDASEGGCAFKLPSLLPFSLPTSHPCLTQQVS